MSEHNEKDLRFYWQEIRKCLVDGDERRAVELFLFVLNQSRNKGIEDAARLMEAQQAKLLNNVQMIYERGTLATAKTMRKTKVTYSPDSIRFEIADIISRSREDVFSTTMSFIIDAAGKIAPRGRQARRKDLVSEKEKA